MSYLGRKMGFKSSTGWEDSHFGGFNRIITDYPFISVPDNLTINIDGSAAPNLQYWEATKVLKMFLLCAKEMHGGVEAIFTGAKSESLTIPKKNWYTGEIEIGFFNKLTTNPKCMQNALNFVLYRESELAPLFKEYEDLIISSTFELLVKREPDASECEGKDGEDGEGDGKPSGEGGDKPGDKPGEDGKMSDEQVKEMAEALGGERPSPSDSKGDLRKDAKSTPKREPGSSPKMNTPSLTVEQVEMLMEAINEMLKDAKKSRFRSSTGGSWKASKSIGGFNKQVEFINVKRDSKPSQLSEDQIMGSELLLKMLDITWDTDSDIVKSLRMGKIDLSKIAEVPAGNVAIYQREIEDQTTKPFSICILMDESGSMGDYYDNQSETIETVSRYTSMYRLVKTLYGAFSQIVPEDKMFIYGHSGAHQPEVYTYHDPHHPNFMYTVDDMKERETMENYDGPVIQAIHKKVRELTDDRIIFLVLSDGAPSGDGYGGQEDVDDLKRIVEKARRDDFVTVGVGIQYSAVELYTYNTVIDDLNDMPKKVSHILNKVVKSEFQ